MPGVLDRIRSYERKRRFWRLVDVRGRAECWPWTGPVDPDGSARYGRAPAASQAYELMRGSLPAGATLKRTCGNRRCVNPEHLERDSAAR
jgi:hypothetical protein